MTRELLEPVVEAGVRSTNFFNGRVLTAEDLRREQDAARERQRGLANAVGAGVVHGLEVRIKSSTLPTPAVEITAGLAYTMDGDPVRLAQPIELRLTAAAAELAAASGIFAPCPGGSTQPEISNPGLYLLVIRPATALSSDRVAGVGLAAEGVGSQCGSRYSEEGGSFALVPLTLPTPGADAPIAQTLTDLLVEIATDVEEDLRNDPLNPDLALRRRLAASQSRLRSGLAFWLAGYDSPGERLRSLAATAPGVAAASLSPLEVMRAAGRLGTADVPLALLHVSRRGMEWLDMWAVRRHPLPRWGPDPLGLVSDDRPRNDIAALVLQFREHLSMFLAGNTQLPAPSTVAAMEWFLFLPPVLVLPLNTESAPGFTIPAFFPWVDYGDYLPAPLSKAQAEPLIRSGLRGGPARLPDDGLYPSLYRFATNAGESTDWENRYILVQVQTHGYWNY